MIRVKAWFETVRNFQKGKLLYDELGKDEDLKVLFQRGKSKTSQISLERALQDLLEHKSLDRVIERSNTPQPKAQAKPSTRRKEKPKETPEELKKPIAQKNDLYIFVRNMHSRMCYAETDKERRELAFQILSTWDAINGLWSKIDYFYANGKLPVVEELNTDLTIKADTNDIIDMYDRYKTLATYISRERKKGNKEREQKAIDESNMIVDIINKIYGHQKLKRK